MGLPLAHTHLPCRVTDLLSDAGRGGTAADPHGLRLAVVGSQAARRQEGPAQGGRRDPSSRVHVAGRQRPHTPACAAAASAVSVSARAIRRLADPFFRPVCTACRLRAHGELRLRRQHDQRAGPQTWWQQKRQRPEPQARHSEAAPDSGSAGGAATAAVESAGRDAASGAEPDRRSAAASVAICWVATLFTCVPALVLLELALYLALTHHVPSCECTVCMAASPSPSLCAMHAEMAIVPAGTQPVSVPLVPAAEAAPRNALTVLVEASRGRPGPRCGHTCTCAESCARARCVRRFALELMTTRVIVVISLDRTIMARWQCPVAQLRWEPAALWAEL